MKSKIEKSNKLLKWKKADPKFKKFYKDYYGLYAEKVGIMTDKAYKRYLNIISLLVNDKDKK